MSNKWALFLSKENAFSLQTSTCTWCGSSSSIQKRATFMLLTDQDIADILIWSTARWVALITTIFSSRRQSHSDNEHPVINRKMKSQIPANLQSVLQTWHDYELASALWLSGKRLSEHLSPTCPFSPFDSIKLSIPLSHNLLAEDHYGFLSQTASSAPSGFASNSISPLSYLALRCSLQLIWLWRRAGN